MADVCSNNIFNPIHASLLTSYYFLAVFLGGGEPEKLITDLSLTFQDYFMDRVRQRVVSLDVQT